jgi:hypothetical protein
LMPFTRFSKNFCASRSRAQHARGRGARTAWRQRRSAARGARAAGKTPDGRTVAQYRGAGRLQGARDARIAAAKGVGGARWAHRGGVAAQAQCAVQGSGQRTVGSSSSASSALSFASFGGAAAALAACVRGRVSAGVAQRAAQSAPAAAGWGLHCGARCGGAPSRQPWQPRPSPSPRPSGGACTRCAAAGRAWQPHVRCQDTAKRGGKPGPHLLDSFSPGNSGYSLPASASSAIVTRPGAPKKWPKLVPTDQNAAAPPP